MQTMVAKRVSAAELATSLPEFLERARTGERFEIERNGEVIATISPLQLQRGITWGEFVATYHTLPRPDDRFADDLEEIWLSTRPRGET
jgi:antitoxin (DNA-binding transcriptional repressor) of toxin-antitoxin stability system